MDDGQVSTSIRLDLFERARALAIDLDRYGLDIAAALADQIMQILATDPDPSPSAVIPLRKIY